MRCGRLKRAGVDSSLIRLLCDTVVVPDYSEKATESLNFCDGNLPLGPRPTSSGCGCESWITSQFLLESFQSATMTNVPELLVLCCLRFCFHLRQHPAGHVSKVLLEIPVSVSTSAVCLDGCGSKDWSWKTAQLGLTSAFKHGCLWNTYEGSPPLFLPPFLWFSPSFVFCSVDSTFHSYSSRILNTFPSVLRSAGR